MWPRALILILACLRLSAQFGGGVLGEMPAGPYVGKKWGLANPRGILVTPYQFADLKADDGGALLAKDLHGHFAVLKPDGSAVTGFDYDYGSLMAGGVIVVRKQGMYGVFSRTGECLVPPQYQAVWVPGHDLVPVRKKGKWGWVDLRAKASIFPEGSFNEVAVLGDDLVALIDKSEKKGVGFHRDGTKRWEMVVTDWLWPLDDQTFYTHRDGANRAFDQDGNEVAFPKNAHNRAFPFQGHNLFGLKDSQGKVLLAPTYKYIYSIEGERFRASNGPEMTLLRASGEPALAKSYYSIKARGMDGRFLARASKESTHWVILDDSGKEEALPGEYSDVLPALTSGLIPVREP